MADIISLVPDDDEIRALLRRWVELERTAAAADEADECERLIAMAFDIEERIALAKPSPVALAVKAFLLFRMDLFSWWTPATSPRGFLLLGNLDRVLFPNGGMQATKAKGGGGAHAGKSPPSGLLSCRCRSRSHRISGAAFQCFVISCLQNCRSI